MTSNISTKKTRGIPLAFAVLLLSTSALAPLLLRADAIEPGLNLSNLAGNSSAPMMATSGSSVYVVWQDDSDTGNFDILFVASSDDGDSFGDVANISANSGFSFRPQIAASGTNVYVVWQDNTEGNDDILFAASSDNGATFGDVLNISNSDGASSSPQIAVTGDNVYIAWQDDNDILFAASSDNGASFDNATNLSSNSGSSFAPQLGESGDNVYAIWMDDTGDDQHFDIYLAASGNNGGSFGEPVNVSDNSGVAAQPQIAISGTGNVYALWSQTEFNSNEEPTSVDILLATSKNDGETFGCPINLSSDIADSNEPQLSLADDGKNLHIIWTSNDLGNNEVLFQGNVNPISPTITINPLANTSPMWDEEIEVSGSAANAGGSSVTIDWGDGSETSDINISGCSWGPEAHSYPGSAVASSPNNLVAKLLNSNGDEKDSSHIVIIDVKAHPTSISLDYVPSLLQGSELEVTGALIDAFSQTPIENGNITFSGTGAGSLGEVTTDQDGSFSSTGAAVNATLDNLTVQAHYAGGPTYDPSDSETRAFDTAGTGATELEVAAGHGSTVDLTGYNASITFDNVLSGGPLFVSECDSPDSPRYLPLDLCLRLSPGFQTDGGPATITISYDGLDIPPGHSASELGIFHITTPDDGPVLIVDITRSRDFDSKTIVGSAASFSNFLVGVTLHGTDAAGTHSSQVHVGDGNVVSLRDITNLQNSSATATIALDDSVFNAGESPQITVTDSNGDVDPSKADIIVVAVESDTSHPASIFVTLTETGLSTGVFKGAFQITSGDSSTLDGLLQAKAGDDISVSYNPGARFQSTIDGVSQAGIVTLSDYIVEDGVCFVSQGSGVDLNLVDAELGGNGKITTTISFANVVLKGADPSSLRIVHKQDGTWIDITSDGGYDADAKTVTGEAVTTGPFSLATNLDDCGGGAGGGFGRGLVVDAVASVAKKSSNSGSSSGGGGGGSSSTGTRSNSIATSIQSGQDVSSTTDKISFNFENVITAGNVNVEEHQLSTEDSMFTSVESEHGRIMSADGSSFSTAGLVFDIKPSTSLQFQGTVDVTIPYSESLTGSVAIAGGSSAEENIRFMHFDGNAWQDLTISVDTAANTVTGRMSSFSPVVAAVVDDGTFGHEYYLEHPMQRLAPISKESAITFADSQGASITNIQINQEVVVVTAIKNPQRVDQDFVYIIELFDANGIVVDLDVVTGSVAGAQTATINEGSIRAVDGGIYTIKAFLLTPDENPQLLADVMTSELPVVGTS